MEESMGEERKSEKVGITLISSYEKYEVNIKFSGIWKIIYIYIYPSLRE